MRRVEGFTLVELSFSLAFIAILSIIVVLIISNSISAYHRGLTLNQLNTTGMDLVDDLRTAVQGSPASSAQVECASIYSDPSTAQECANDYGLGFIVAKRRTEVKVSNNSIGKKTPVYGAFCTGEYSYLWNSGYFFGKDRGDNVEINNASALSLKYTIKGDAGSEPSMAANFKLLKIRDGERTVCKIASGVNASSVNGSDYKQNDMPNMIDVSSTGLEEAPVDVLIGNNNLAVYDLDVAPPAEIINANNMFYTVSFVLGTIQGGINVMAQGNYCAAPEDLENASVENFDYCAINKFNFAAQAIGG